MSPTRDPLFVIGCPRSGTTLLLDLLAGTRAFGYVATSGRRRDARESLHGRTRIYDAPFVGDVLYRRRGALLASAARLGRLHRLARRHLPSAIEPWEFWSDLLPGFRPEFGDGPAVDPSPDVVDEAARARARDVVTELLRTQRREMLVSKYTDFPRIALLRSVFPGARFVHIRRDGAAVANSYAVEIESGRFGTWAYRDWWAAQWSTGERAHWHAHGTTPLGFAAHNRNRLLRLLDRATADDPGVLDVTYESLVAAPAEEVGRILDFAGVEPRADVGRLVASRRVVDTNERWRMRRTPEEIGLVESIITDGSTVAAGSG